MKTKFPQESQNHQEEIKEIAEIIKEKGKNKIAYIILFGSFARGDWVEDFRQESDGSWGCYNSDYDFLIITKHEKQASRQATSVLKNKIEKETERRGLLKAPYVKNRPTTMVIEPLGFVNRNLRRGQYFFADIKKEGILLYKAEDVEELSETKKLTNIEKKEMAQEYFDEWFEYAEEFFDLYNYSMKKEFHKKAAFNLHQTTENLFSCLLLVFINYRPRTHNLEELLKDTIPHCKELRNIFPLNDEKEKKHFELLNSAYVGRYKRDYAITKEELEYLQKRVETLKDITLKSCKTKILSFAKS